MGYRLECTGSASANNATEADIRRAFDDDVERGDFAILIAPDGSFMQIGEGAGPFVLEHRDGGTEEHIQSKAKVSKAEAREAFLQYLRGDPAWRTSREWEPLKETGGCLSVVLIASAIFGGGVLAACVFV